MAIKEISVEFFCHNCKHMFTRALFPKQNYYCPQCDCEVDKKEFSGSVFDGINDLIFSEQWKNHAEIMVSCLEFKNEYGKWPDEPHGHAARIIYEYFKEADKERDLKK